MRMIENPQVAHITCDSQTLIAEPGQNGAATHSKPQKISVSPGAIMAPADMPDG
jgi:hypothetical protein